MFDSFLSRIRTIFQKSFSLKNMLDWKHTLFFCHVNVSTVDTTVLVVLTWSWAVENTQHIFRLPLGCRNPQVNINPCNIKTFDLKCDQSETELRLKLINICLNDKLITTDSWSLNKSPLTLTWLILIDVAGHRIHFLIHKAYTIDWSKSIITMQNPVL